MSASAVAHDAHVSTAWLRARYVLPCLVAGVAALHALLALRSPVPWIIPDELRYAELAKSLGSGDLPHIRDRVTFGFGLAYPALLAPVWALIDDVSRAYAVAKVINALALALTAVPAYFLARRFLPEAHALLVAFLAVSIPSLLYAGTIMTEVALYPTFVLALLAIAIALERPTRSMQSSALLAIALASSVKILATTLIIGYVGAVLLFHWLDTRGAAQWRQRLAAYRLTWLTTGSLVLVGATVAPIVGRGPTVILGDYEGIVDRTVVTAIPRWIFLHVAAFDHFVAVIPFAATVVVVREGLRRNAGNAHRLIATLILAVSTPLFFAVALYSSNPSPGEFGYASGAGANERATFVLAPLMFIAFVLWLQTRPGSPRVLIGAAVVAAFLPATIPLDEFEENVNFQAFALVPWVGVHDVVPWPLGVLVLTVTLASSFLVTAFRGVRRALVVLPVVVVFLGLTFIGQSSMELVSMRTQAVGVGQSLTWVDDAVGRRGPVSVLWYEESGQPYVPVASRHRALWLAEFFNRSVGEVLEMGSPLQYGLPATRTTLDGDRVVLEDGTSAPLDTLVLTPCHVRVEGEVIATDSTGLTVVRVATLPKVTVGRPGVCPEGTRS